MHDFVGAKVALIIEGKVVVIRRDNKPDLRFANMWDLPGGGRRARETPEQCAVREVTEELGIALSPSSFTWKRDYPAIHDPRRSTFFLVAPITQQQIASIRFGDEGQGWQLMEVSDFLASREAVEPLKQRLHDYLEAAA